MLLFKKRPCGVRSAKREPVVEVSIVNVFPTSERMKASVTRARCSESSLLRVSVPRMSVLPKTVRAEPEGRRSVS